MVTCVLRDLKVAAVAALALWAMGACGGCGSTSAANTSTAGPTQAQLAAAAISGHWQLTVTVDAYTGPQPPSTNIFPPGHHGVDDVVLVSRCAGGCTLQIYGPSGPDANFYAFYSNVTSFEGPPVSMPMTEAGATYSQVIPISGFGGAHCPPSPTIHAPQQQISLTVTGAIQSGGGWLATKLSGAEVIDAGWGCSSGAFSGWTIEHLKISAAPH